MENQDDQIHFVKRVVLPSGKTIEVVYFKDTGDPLTITDALPEPAPRAPEHPHPEPDQDLTLCIDCTSDLVYPVEWEESGPENWNVLLHCPNCEVYREGVFSQDTVESFDEEIERGSDALTRDYRQLARANMADEIELFVGALKAGAILPEDF